MGSRDIPVAVSDTDLIGKWLEERAGYMRKLEYRERELLELHEDYIALELRCNALMGVIIREARRYKAEIAERKRMEAANEAICPST